MSHPGPVQVAEGWLIMRALLGLGCPSICESPDALHFAAGAFGPGELCRLLIGGTMAGRVACSMVSGYA